MQAEDDGSLVTAAGHGVTERSTIMECVESCTAEYPWPWEIMRQLTGSTATDGEL